MNNLELPLLPATALDSMLGSKPGVQKLRQELRKELGTDNSESFFSLGRRGTVNLEASPLFACLVTGARWNRERAQHLATVYNSAGLEQLIDSGRFAKALETAGKRLKDALAAGGKSADLITTVVTVVSELTRNDDEFRRFAEEMTQINRRVDQLLREVRRMPGRVVRIEGDEAMVVIENGDREELRSLPVELLRTTGIAEEEGSSFVLHEMTWSPDLQSRIAIPAIDVDVDEEHEARLRAAETPLPRPSGA